MTVLRKAALAVLVGGTAAGLGAAVVTDWPGRTGIAALIAAGWLAWSFGRREVAQTRSHGHDELMQATRRAYDSLVAERATNDHVVGLLRERNETVTSSLVELRGELLVRQAELAERRLDLARLRGDNQSLKLDVAALVERVDTLSGQIDTLSVADADRSGAEILSLPRRPMKHQRMLWSDDDVWGEDDMPSVVDLVKADSVTARTDPGEALRHA